MQGRGNFISILFTFNLFVTKVFSLSEWWENSKVLELTNDNFDQHVGKDKYVVVKFYTKWCFYCKQMAPEFEKLYDHYKETHKRNDLEIARIEASENDDISLRYGIFSFPRVILFGPGDPRIRSVFDNKPRLLKFFVNWIDKEAPAAEMKQDATNNNDNKAQIVSSASISSETEHPSHGVTDTKYNPNIDNTNGEKLTSEIEFVKRDFLSMKTRIESLEDTVKQLKIELNSTLADVDKHKTNSSSSSFSFSYVLIILLFVILVAGVVTIKRIFIKVNNSALENHMKV